MPIDDDQKSNATLRDRFKQLPDFAQALLFGLGMGLPLAIVLAFSLGLFSASPSPAAVGQPPIVVAVAPAVEPTNEKPSEVVFDFGFKPLLVAAPAPTTDLPTPSATITRSSSWKTTAPAIPSNSREKTVHVRGYTRKDGTYVREQMRRPPRR
jgi:hypothetical protein